MASWLDRIVYRVKAAAPWVYDLMAAGNAALTIAVHGRRIRRVLADAAVSGTVFGEQATMRPLDVGDLDQLFSTIAAASEDHLRFFHPHGLDRQSLRRVLKSRTILTYGLFKGDDLVAYALIKLFVAKRAYIGRLVAASMAGLGIGRFVTRYLYWQGYQLGFSLRATVHQDNIAVLRSHDAVRPSKVIADLPNGFKLREYSFQDADAHAPKLCVERKSKAPEDSKSEGQ